MIKEIKLVKPILVNGAERDTFKYDLDELNISAITAAENLKGRLAGFEASTRISFAQTDFALHICIAIYAIIAVEKDVAEEDLLRIKGYDISQLALIGSHFFIKPALVPSPKSELQQETSQDVSDVQ